MTGRATGSLCLVGTPIGNLGDLWPAAEDRLRTADVVCAEDTRRTRKLLSARGIRPARLVSLRAENEDASVARVNDWLRQGKEVVLVSDAGMPGLSDPGQRLVQAVLAADGHVTVAPGPDAATAALAVSGLPTAQWCFEGFLPRRTAHRRQRIDELRHERRTIVLFEAPHRLARTLAELESSVGPDRPAAVVNDLTKRFEAVWRGPLGQVRRSVVAEPVQGEFVIVLGSH